MSRNARTMPMGVLARARAAVAHVPHVDILTAEWMRDISTPGGPIRSIRFNVDAWGPTLHGRRLRWTVASDPKIAMTLGLNTPDLSDDEALDLADSVSAYAPTQEALAAWAAREGIDQPINAAASGSFGTFADLGHLRIDRRLLDLMVANRGASGAAIRLLDLIERMIRSGEGRSDTHIVTDELDDSLNAGASFTAVNAGAAFDEVFTTLWVEERLGARGQMVGDTLEIDETLPDTLLKACAGRRLGEVVSTGVASLDDAVILSAIRGSFNDSRFKLVADDVRIDEQQALCTSIPTA